MQKIPLRNLESFEKFYLEAKTKTPTRHQEQVRNPSISYFSIFLRTEHPCKTEIDINRSEFYKILLITEGSGVLTYGAKEYLIKPTSLLFLKPSEVKSWKATTTKQGGYYCIFTDQFYAMFSGHLRELRHGLLFGPGSSPVLTLNEREYGILSPLFEKLLTEFNERNDYNIEIVRMYLHVLLLESARIIGQSHAHSFDNSAASLLTERFLKLLDDEFTKDENKSCKLKFPSDFADQLSVHKNHLNAFVKMVTGKTVTEHIHKRLLTEAQLLLTHTDLNVSEIAYKLGFKETAHFSSFFKKNLTVTPVAFKRVIAP